MRRCSTSGLVEHLRARRLPLSAAASRSTGWSATWSSSRAASPSSSRNGLPKAACRHAIFNLKLPMKKRYDEVALCLAIVRDAVHRRRVEVRAKQLYHDREEITVFARARRKGAAAAVIRRIAPTAVLCRGFSKGRPDRRPFPFRTRDETSARFPAAAGADRDRHRPARLGRAGTLRSAPHRASAGATAGQHRSHPALAALIQIGLMTLAIATGIPGAIVVVLAGGMLFGIAAGTVLSSIGTTLGALILFLASRSAFAHGGGQAPALVEKLRAGYHAYPISYAMFLRLVPFFPFGGVTVALAWLRCPLWLFATATAIGGTVMIAFETALGAGLTETIAREGVVSLSIFTHRRVLLPLLGMAVLSLVPILLAQLRRVSRKEG